MEPTAGGQVVGPQLEFFEDSTGELTLEQVSAPEFGGPWQRSRQDTVNFGLSPSVYWLRFKVENRQSSEEDLILELSMPLVDYLDVYLRSQDGHQIDYRTGDRRDFDTRPVVHRNFLFPFRTQPGSQTEVYLRLASEDGFHEALPLTLWRQAEFTAKDALAERVVGAYIGVLGIMLLYNLVILFYIKDRSYLFYVLYLAGYLLWYAAYAGLLKQYLWPTANWWANHGVIFFGSLFPAAFAWFADSFMNLAGRKPWLGRLIRLMGAVWLLLGLAALLIDYSTWLSVTPPFAVFALLSALVVGFYYSAKGVRAARIYSVSFLVLLAGFIPFWLKIAGVLPSNSFTENAPLVGSALEVLLLSVGLADRINVLNKEMARLNMVKDEFLANLSHEMRTPLTTIQSYAEMMSEGMAGEETVKAYARQIEEDGARLNLLIEDLLLATRLDSSILHDLPRLSIAPLIDQSVKRSAPLAREREVRVHIDVTSGLQAPCDAGLLSRTLDHLIQNAIRYNNAGGEVHISARADSNKITILVRDNGIGIDESHLSHVCERFYRVDTSIGYKESGTGLGLYLASLTATKHGGQLLIRSQLQVGTTVELQLPA
ncbi:MAG: sensor histidine kinase [Spirochaetales bacterium]|nr:sensor histidine kinase [Leptospiraceae bacterium]MCP5481325.1 sensor histidine kinase [Spirochaetales bacterium]MCP5485762.1 sensor histidine kinase [Spirochaetales bacterium]